VRRDGLLFFSRRFFFRAISCSSICPSACFAVSTSSLGTNTLKKVKEQGAVQEKDAPSSLLSNSQQLARFLSPSPPLAIASVAFPPVPVPMATRRASTRVSNGSSSSSHPSPDPPAAAAKQKEKRRAPGPPSFPALDASEEEIFGRKKIKTAGSQEVSRYLYMSTGSIESRRC